MQLRTYCRLDERGGVHYAGRLRRKKPRRSIEDSCKPKFVSRYAAALCALVSVMLVVGCSSGNPARHVAGGPSSSSATHAGNEARSSARTTDSAAPIGVPSIEILYSRWTKDHRRWQMCMLHLPSRKVEVLIDKEKAQRLGDGLAESVFSPDGQLVLLTAGDLSDLWIFNRRTKSLRRVTADKQGYDSLQWSSDGRYISAQGMRGWTPPETPPTQVGGMYSDLYVWGVRTGRRTLVLKNADIVGWLRTTDRLFALADDWRLYTWDARTGKKRLIAEDVENAAWSHDGKALLFRKWGSADILSVRSSGLAVTAVPGRSSTLLWVVSELGSPDGSRAIELNVSEHQGDDPYSTEIAVVDSRSGKRISSAVFKDLTRPVGWSRDGRTIIVLNQVRTRTVIGGKVDIVDEPGRIFAVSSDTGATRDLGSLPTSGALQSTSYEDWRLARGL